MTQRMIHIDSPLFVREERLKDGEDVTSIFDRQGPLALEIGCGTGDFLLQMARLHPEVNFLGTDIYNKGCYKTCRKADLAGVQNIRVVRMEARHLLSNHIRRESLQAVYINCPDPWPKKRHRRRRLINSDFLQLLLYCLSPGGRFYFCTDFADYAQGVAELFPCQGFRNQLPEPFVNHLEGYPSSKYMERFRREDLPLYFMVQSKDREYRLEYLEPPPVPSPFRKPAEQRGIWAETT
ncbi:MAG: tRNA (guanosine(46)-N7)-methyltransferase TrmB [Deltaproteobacteria bacterium]|nr:tRNA (guanosine(46)-N7)-methyltransferase TrmB [Deltaproteobacteria bacterium]